MESDPIFSYALNDGVHHIAPLEATANAIKNMLGHIEQVFLENPPQDKVRVLVDFRPAGPPPMAQSLPHLISFLSRQAHDNQLMARIAYIYPHSEQGRILTAFLTMQRFMPQRMTVRFFNSREEDQAMAWLHA